MKTSPLVGCLACALALTLPACGSDTSETALTEVVADDDQLSRFTEGLETTGLDEVLEGEGSYTLLAPHNEAFAALGADGEALFDEPERAAILAAVLRDHMVPGALDPQAMRDTIEERGGAVYMVNFGNGELSVEADGEDLVIKSASGQSARVSGEAVISENGVIIPIDTVLVDANALGVPVSADGGP